MFLLWLRRRGGTERIGSKESRTPAKKSIFLGRYREREIMSWPDYIDDNGKATESSGPAELNLVLGLFCFRAICHPLSDHALLAALGRGESLFMLFA